ncbi:MAG TPA: ATP-binding protein [Acidobacteriaceae bacterium]|nr:ATP-binding protein [Acidobacteriaceae bacterium]
MAPPIIRKAARKKAKLRLALVGPTGSGKTYSALKLAFGIGGKIGLIDTENGSGDLYAHLGDYDVISLESPYTVQKYREAIRAFEAAEYDTIVVDSLSHAWAGEGGLLDKQGQLEKSGSYKNSFATWREITPEHNKLVEEMLGSPAHIVATMRTKTEYVIEEDSKGRKVPRKIGLSPVQRDGVEYEFTVVMDVADNHYARASKDRTEIFDGWSDKISEETGRRLKEWLESGVEPPKPYPLVSRAGTTNYKSAQEYVEAWTRLIDACVRQGATDKLEEGRRANANALSQISQHDADTAAKVNGLLDSALFDDGAAAEPETEDAQ